MLLKDRFDREVTVGCVVAYPGRQSSSCWITTGKVTEILDEDTHHRARLRLVGGCGRRRWNSSAELGQRMITWSDQVIVISHGA